MIRFEELVEMLPSGTKLPPALEDVEVPGAISFPDAGQSGFIAPDFELAPDQEGGLSSARVILIAAPAAVGKSWLASELSASSGNPLWDLSRFNVGSGFFTGTLNDTFGPEGYSILTKRLNTGDACLILDAADEALVRVGSNSFQAGLENLARLLGPSDKRRIGAVLLGRPDTIAESKKILEQAGVAARELRVEFFSEEQARNFVRTKANSEKYKVVAELDDFLDSFFRNVMQALDTTAWYEAADFLGYSPVLDALATFYNEAANPMKLMSELQREQSAGHVWRLLIKVIDAILDRESEKFAEAFGAGDAAKAAYGAETYSRRAQQEYLLSDDPENFLPDLPNEGNEDWLGDLEDQVRRQFVEHPLRRTRVVQSGVNPLDGFANAAFRDYALAAMFGWGTPALVEQSRDYWRAPSINPSLMLSRFVFAMYSASDSPIPLSALGMVADSHAAGSNVPDAPILTLSEEWESVDGDASSVQAALGGLSDQRDPQGWVGFDGPDDEHIEFYRGLARCVIDVSQRRVLLGSGAQDFVLGPDVLLLCKILSSEAVEIRVPYAAQTVVSIRCERVQGASHRITAKAPNNLAVQTKSAGHPWPPFIVRGDSRPVQSDKDIVGAALEMRRLVSWFARSSMVAGSLSYPASAFDVILKKGRVSNILFSFFRNEGILGQRDASYTLTFDFPATAILQVDLGNVAYSAMLRDYVVWRQVNQ